MQKSVTANRAFVVRALVPTSERCVVLDVPAATDSACERALCALLDAQELRARNPMAYGGIIERPMTKGPVSVCTRSSCYALIYLLKEFAGVKDYLKA